MDISNLLYNHNNKVSPHRGSLLIAEPLLQQDIFSRSVVMILDEDRHQGHLGLILNKPTTFSFNDLIPDSGLERDIPVFCGGPVDQSRLFMLHSLGDRFEDSTEIIPGIYVGGRIEDIYDYLESGGETEGKIRFFLGYSGWTAGQVKSEIERNTWAVGNCSRSAGDFRSNAERLLEGESNEFWRREVRNLGPSYRSWLVIPSNPLLN